MISVLWVGCVCFGLAWADLSRPLGARGGYSGRTLRKEDGPVAIVRRELREVWPDHVPPLVPGLRQRDHVPLVLGKDLPPHAGFSMSDYGTSPAASWGCDRVSA
jgi:hypothetical protein